MDDMSDTQFAQLVGGLVVAWLIAGLMLGSLLGRWVKTNDQRAERAYQRKVRGEK